jgi:dipeptidyl aminopeptidase/acylaminoacyl peptidase
MLKSIDLKTNQETKIAHDSKSDIINVLFIDDKPSVYSTVWLKKQWHSLGKLDLKKITQQLGSSFDVTSQAKNIWVIRYVEPKRIGASFYLYDIDTGQITMLYEARTNKHLADMIPFEFTTRDGLLLTAYLTLPEKYASIESIKKPIPLIVHPHGGPFQARDNWEYDPFHQWLASRGYAVLSVNFRLSSGLGKKLVNAGNGEWGRKAQYDLIDGMQWCIEQGITTKDKVGIVGASYGGYATLAGLAFTPDEFAVGVDLVGPSNLITTMQKVPNYWDWPSYKLSDRELFFTKGAFIKSMGGNPDTQAGREFLASRSPLNYANQISKPLLIIQGDNDPIINKSESIQIYNELKRLGKKTCLLSFPDEGHRIQRYPNQETYLAYIEQWLHDILGGEVEPLNHKLRAESSVVIQE